MFQNIIPSVAGIIAGATTFKILKDTSAPDEVVILGTATAATATGVAVKYGIDKFGKPEVVEMPAQEEFIFTEDDYLDEDLIEEESVDETPEGDETVTADPGKVGHRRIILPDVIELPPVPEKEPIITEDDYEEVIVEEEPVEEDDDEEDTGGDESEDFVEKFLNAVEGSDEDVDEFLNQYVTEQPPVSVSKGKRNQRRYNTKKMKNKDRVSRNENRYI